MVSGNVSLYNETGGRAIPPTPTVGMVGLLEDVSLAVPAGFATADSRPGGVARLSQPANTPATVAFPRLDLDAEQTPG